MKAVVYCRYSSDSQTEQSIDGQLRVCKEYATAKGITIINTYIDRAQSGTNDNRLQFQKMLADSDKRLFDIVLVYQLDRFARNRYDSAINKAKLKKNGVRVVSARENISDDASGVLMEAVLEGMAEYFSVELSQKVKRGQKENALKCKHNGGYITFGYVVDENQFYHIDPITAPIVLEVYTRYSKGETIKQLVDDFNDRGVKTLRGKKFTIHIVTDMLNNPRYGGTYTYGEISVPDGMPAIIPKELFDRVQKRMEDNKRAPARYKADDRYLLTTKLFCGRCGAMMAGESGTSKTERKYYYYKCGNSKRKKGCDKKAVKKVWIEDLVVAETMNMLLDDELLERLADMLFDMQSKESTEIPLLKQQLAETEKGIENMLNAIQQGIITKGTKERLDKLEQTKSDLEVRLLEEQINRPLLTREQISFWLYRFRNTDVTKQDQRERLIDSFVNAVYVYDNRLVLTFNYKDGTKTISLAVILGVSQIMCKLKIAL